MHATLRVDPGELAPLVDQVVILHGASWAQYEAVLDARGDRPVPRIAYLDGEIELMSPSRSHERIKSRIGRLLEAYARHEQLIIDTMGSPTLKEEPKAAGGEPDESYAVGSAKASPDLAIEVVWSHEGIGKMEIYARLGIPEVWRWRKNQLEVYRLGPAGDERSLRSVLFPRLDLDLLLRHLDQPTMSEAVDAYATALRAQPG